MLTLARSHPLKLAALTFLAVSFLGGSLIWYLFGFGDDLAIDGRAPQVRTDVGGFGSGWSAYGGDAKGARYSNADQVTPATIGALKPAWTFRTGAFEGREAAKGRSAFEATPILVEDSLVFCTQFNEVIAVDPGSGAELWRFDPELDLSIRPDNQFTCRGVAYWRDGASLGNEVCGSRILAATVDARLFALDARTGQICPDFGSGGFVQLSPDQPVSDPGEYTITSAPTIIGDVVVTGSSIGDNQKVKAASGTVFAFDVRTGAARWEFNPVPRDPSDPARPTWGRTSAGEHAADVTGHANVWSTMSVDEERGLIFLPTSSPSPDFYGGERAGGNLYTNSVVALNGETGDLVWHFQTVHHDVWDYDVPAQPGLYEVWRNGRAHDVVAQVTKMGFVFVLDRETGEPFLPVEERPVPLSDVPGEALSPTQPFPVNTPSLVPTNIDAGDAFGVTLWDRLYCAARIGGARNEGLYTPPSFEGTLMYPFTGGGANWGSTAFDPSRNLLIVNVNSAGHIIKLYANETPLETNIELGPMDGTPYKMTRELLLGPTGLPCTPPPYGMLAAVDLSSGQIVWRQSVGTTQDLAAGIALPLGTPAWGGPIVTAGGLVLMGATMDNYLRAFDVETGKELWKGRLPAGGQATPMTYVWEGRQYVVIAAGGHARSTTKLGDYVIAFALPEN